MDQKKNAIMYVQEELSEQEDDKVLIKRFASGESEQKQVRFEETTGQVQDQGQVSGAARVRRRPMFTPKEKPHRKKGPKKKSTRWKSAIEALIVRAERYDFLNSLTRSPAGITFGQIANGDVDKVKKELQNIIANMVTRSAVNVTSEYGQSRVPPNRHQVVKLSVYSEPVYGLLDSGAILNFMSDMLAEKLRLQFSPKKRRILVADGSTRDCAAILEEILASFGEFVVRLKFIVIKSLRYELIIVSSTLVDMCDCIDLYHQTVKVRKDEKMETLNLVYEPEMYEDTEDELTTDTESDIGEDSAKHEYGASVLSLSDVTESPFFEKDVDQV